MQYLLICTLTLTIAATSLFAQTDEITDPRDGQQYQTVTVGNTQWMAENLKFDTENAVAIRFSGDPKEGERFYPLKDAAKACPADWRLPTPQDWGQMIQLSIPSSNFKQLVYEEGIPTYGEVEVQNEHTPLNMRLVGAYEEALYQNGSIVTYWLDCETMPNCHLHIENSTSEPSFAIHEHDLNQNKSVNQQPLFSIRCVKDAEP